MLATFALILIFSEGTRWLFGSFPLYLDIPPALSGAVPLPGGAQYPLYRLAIIAAGIIVLGVVQGAYATEVLRGAILGLTAYATFDLTNLAILKGWTPLVAAVDIAWGVFVTTVVAVAGMAVGRRCGAG